MDYKSELETRGLEPYDSGPGYIMMLCPLHDDTRPSFSVSLANGAYRCFGCEDRGTFAELIAELDGIGVDEAIRSLRVAADAEDSLSVLERALNDDEEDKAVVFNEKSFHKVYPPVLGTPGEWYLRARHGASKVPLAEPRALSEDTVLRFDARWAPKGKYKGRVVFPIRMPSGKIVSYVGRTIYAGVEPKTRKAVSPKHTLFGIDQLLIRFGSVKHVVLVEGEFDAMYLQQFGVPALSVMGTSPLSVYQIRLLKRLKATIVLSYDGDAAGSKAMFGDGKKRIGEVNVLSRLMPTIAVVLPAEQDPNKLTAKEVSDIYGRFKKVVRKT